MSLFPGCLHAAFTLVSTLRDVESIFEHEDKYGDRLCLSSSRMKRTSTRCA
ncbi:MAG: hypothetical protein GTO76_03790 [Planctomycetales bacterium]|nr:hypothetical protein [Planctomycetales bacterium]NIN76924.1 hypothetical protein [Planctomycetales bacterium]NIO34112.1 hypothetical protein [Planctomycetales bacterium]NIO45910.1 hypothetical protein [Planctomycetales bacterium]NIP03971.1 hypothetical protein [Planctomycetales bacterium]